MTPLLKSSTTLFDVPKSELFKKIYLLVMTLILPVTVLVLWLLRFISVHGLHPDVLGLSAISVGIVGVLVFFMFLYKYQIHSGMTARRRWIAMLFHIVIIMLLFLIVIFLGFISEAGKTDMWGNYSIEIASRSWVIAILVVGTITLLGSFFDLIGYSSRILSQSREGQNENGKP